MDNCVNRINLEQSSAVAQDVPLSAGQVSLVALNERSREIFRQIVDSYLATGEPMGSRHLSRLISMPLSPASVRNVMQDLEELGLIYAPHTSAGRLPTERGLRFFVDALMQVGDLSDRDREAIEGQVAAAGTTVENVLTEASTLLSGLTRAAGVVLTTTNSRSSPMRLARPLEWMTFIKSGRTPQKRMVTPASCI